MREKGLLEEEQTMKYHGITIQKNKKCDTYYARFTVGGKQHYLADPTVKGCYNKLVKALKPENVEKLLEEQKDIGEYITFGEWYQKWLEMYKIGKVKPETMRCYNTMLKYIPESFNKTQMKDITLAQVINIVNGVGADRQQQKFHEFLSMVFSKAVDNDIISKNFMEKIDKPKHKKKHSLALTVEEQNNLIKVCEKIPKADVFIVALCQGLRRGEVLGLTRDCVDFEHKKITIDKAWTQRNTFDTTKNEQSERTTPMFDKAYEVLIKYKDKKPNERIFDLTTKQYELVLEKIREYPGLEAIKMKDMRSTFITNCMNKNIPLHIIQSWVGHEIGSIVTTSIYTSHNEEADKEYIETINDFTQNMYN